MTDYAQLAQSLKDNEAFQLALTNVRADAIDKLIRIDADDRNGLIEAQATVKVVDEIRDNLEQFIRSGKPRAASGIA